MREGELIGLKPMDVDFHGRFIEVRRNVVRGKVTTPKNGRTRRVDSATRDKGGTVTIAELVVASLAQSDALSKLLIEKGLITEGEFMHTLSKEKAGYQALLQKLG